MSKRKRKGQSAETLRRLRQKYGLGEFSSKRGNSASRKAFSRSSKGSSQKRRKGAKAFDYGLTQDPLTGILNLPFGEVGQSFPVVRAAPVKVTDISLVTGPRQI